MTGGEMPFLDDLGDQLLRAEPPRPDRGPGLRRAAVAAGAVVVVLLAVLAAGTFQSDRAAAGIDVRRIGNRVQLRVEGKAPPAAEIQEIAKRNGLDIRIEEVPTGPSLVGKMFMVGAGPPPGVLRFGPNDVLDVKDHGFDAISFPVNWKGYVDLRIGRPARPDEDEYGLSPNALAPGEAFACERGDTADQVLATATRKDVYVRWWLHEPDGFTVRREVAFDPKWKAQGYRVAYAAAIGPRSVIVELTPGGRWIEPRAFERFPSC